MTALNGLNLKVVIIAPALQTYINKVQSYKVNVVILTEAVRERDLGHLCRYISFNLCSIIMPSSLDPIT